MESLFFADYSCLATAEGLLSAGMEDVYVTYDMFFREIPDNGGFAVMAGIEQLTERLKNISFSEQELEFLEEQGFSEKLIDYLRNFKFKCSVYAVPEGTPIFPNEPIVKVQGPSLQAQLIETLLLNTVNHQTLIATKANRIVRASQGRKVIEMGARRAHGLQSAIDGARAGFIGGVGATTLFSASRKYGIPAANLMSHGWVQLFDSELDAFKTYLVEHGADGMLLVDTYDTLDSGVKNAIEAFNEVLVPNGLRPAGIIIDSGDMTYLSKRARRLLDEAGFPDCDIYASNSLDETLIKDMLNQGAKIDGFIIGEKLITSSSSPILDGVYKLCETTRNGEKTPAIMVSNNVTKITTPCSKRVWRLFDMESGKAVADVLTLDSESIENEKTYSLFDPDFTWKRKTVDNFVARELLVKIFDEGECVYNMPSLENIKKYCEEQVDSLWEEVTRFENPHRYYVDFSGKLWGIKQSMIEKITRMGEAEEQ
ncbi:MAG: nicotinate phosphoribosyltransferase [Oscillospiraceae bacterium]|nr:nicotinate phosphoribosyltransferase [Oscillospiraceae bacterium]